MVTGTSNIENQKSTLSLFVGCRHMLMIPYQWSILFSLDIDFDKLKYISFKPP